MYSFVLRHSLTFFIKQVFISRKLFKQIRHIYLFLCVSNLCFFFPNLKSSKNLTFPEDITDMVKQYDPALGTISRIYVFTAVSLDL